MVEVILYWIKFVSPTMLYSILNLVRLHKFSTTETPLLKNTTTSETLRIELIKVAPFW